MRTKLVAFVFAVLLVAGGFAGRGLVDHGASAASTSAPWSVAYVKSDCATAPECAGKTVEGNPTGDQGVLSNLLATLNLKGCFVQSIAPYGSAWFVVIYRC